MIDNIVKRGKGNHAGAKPALADVSINPRLDVETLVSRALHTRVSCGSIEAPTKCAKAAASPAALPSPPAPSLAAHAVEQLVSPVKKPSPIKFAFRVLFLQAVQVTS